MSRLMTLMRFKYSCWSSSGDSSSDSVESWEWSDPSESPEPPGDGGPAAWSAAGGGACAWSACSAAASARTRALRSMSALAARTRSEARSRISWPAVARARARAGSTVAVTTRGAPRRGRRVTALAGTGVTGADVRPPLVAVGVAALRRLLFLDIGRVVEKDVMIVRESSNYTTSIFDCP